MMIEEKILLNHERYCVLKDPIISKKQLLQIKSKDEYSRLEQGSEAWIMARDLYDENVEIDGVIEISDTDIGINDGIEMRIGSSQVAEALGFFTGYALKVFDGDTKKEGNMNSFLNFWCRKQGEKKDFPREVKINLEWGRNHERNAVLYTLEKFKSIKVQACGSYIHKIKGYPIEVFTTPDFLFEDIKNGMMGCGEVKTPSPFFWDEKIQKYKHSPRYPFKKIPEYYVPQKEFQMISTGRNRSLFGSYTTSNGMKWVLSESNLLYIKLCEEALCWGFENYFQKPKNIPKSGNPFKDYKNYNELLKLTKKLSTTWLAEYQMDNLGIEPWDNKYFLD